MVRWFTVRCLNLRGSMIPVAAWLALAVWGQGGGAATIEVVVQGGAKDATNVPVCVGVALPANQQALKVIRLTGGDDIELLGQFTAPSLLSEANGEGGAERELHFVVPRLKKGATLTLRGSLENVEPSGPVFHWEDSRGKQADLLLGAKPVLRYMYERVDGSSQERRMETFKVYHHVFDPQGERLVTKGPGGLFPHHRGVFYGFNKITHDGDKQADVWHCRNGESQTHEEFISLEEGPILGRHRVGIAWRGRDGKPFANEQREMTVYNTPGGTLIEFASRLESVDGKVLLDGDPQHAGFQFRASQHVPDKTAKQTYYVRPDGKGEPGKFRNWPQDKEHVNLPWNALSIVIDDQRYTCVYLDHPDNPKEARFSERDYGRFGSYFEAQIEGDKTLDVNYRLWLQEGEISAEDAAARSAKFVHPPTVAATVKQ